MINFLAFQPHKSQNQQSIVYQENPRTRGSRSQANLLASEANSPAEAERMNFCSENEEPKWRLSKQIVF